MAVIPAMFVVLFPVERFYFYSAVGGGMLYNLVLLLS
jgi:hypothetical protein